MENASKALIIAGAILLSILIIGLGMTIYNSASSSMGNANLDAQEVQAHNSQFLSYEGKQKGPQVRALVNAIRANNRDYTDRMIKIKTDNIEKIVDQKVKPSDVECTAPTDSTDPNEAVKGADGKTTGGYADILGKIKNNTTYYVTYGYSENGCIGGVEIHIWSQVD